ncbi:hypothetical protein C8J56DRAFT_883964 [Mycena floridula]|nr:hypothetical protein C8J56DRAFT_883964 [Mycena floridula]
MVSTAADATTESHHRKAGGSVSEFRSCDSRRMVIRVFRRIVWLKPDDNQPHPVSEFQLVGREGRLRLGIALHKTLGPFPRIPTDQDEITGFKLELRRILPDDCSLQRHGLCIAREHANVDLSHRSTIAVQRLILTFAAGNQNLPLDLEDTCKARQGETRMYVWVETDVAKTGSKNQDSMHLLPPTSHCLSLVAPWRTLGATDIDPPFLSSTMSKLFTPLVTLSAAVIVYLFH